MFEAPYDLLTTLDRKVRSRLQSWPGLLDWCRWLRPRVIFAGTTVTEYLPLPQQVDPAAIVHGVLAQRRTRALLIVKDLPVDSPLLSGATNAYAADLRRALKQAGFLTIAGQALAYVAIDFADVDAYLARLSAGRRKDLRRKLRIRAELQITSIATGDEIRRSGLAPVLHAMYLEVYMQSEVHFDRLSLPFFEAILTDASSGGRLFLYHREGQLIGFNLCYVCGEMLIDKYVGFRYPQAREANLYFVSWMHNLQYALTAGLRFYVAGWTDAAVKKQLGASFTFTEHAVFVRNPLLRVILRKLCRLFESDARLLQES